MQEPGCAMQHMCPDFQHLPTVTVETIISNTAPKRGVFICRRGPRSAGGKEMLLCSKRPAGALAVVGLRGCA